MRVIATSSLDINPPASASGLLSRILQKYNIQINMGSKGRALDNVFIERFWRSLKGKNLSNNFNNCKKEAKAAIKEYIDFYNPERMHQALGYITPSLMYCKQKIA